MEYPFSSKDKVIYHWASPRVQMEGMASLDGVPNFTGEGDSFCNDTEFMNLEAYAGWFSSPSATEQMLVSYLPPLHSIASLDPVNFTEHTIADVLNTDDSLVEYPFGNPDRMVAQWTLMQCDVSLASADLGYKRGQHSHQQNIYEDEGSM